MTVKEVTDLVMGDYEIRIADVTVVVNDMSNLGDDKVVALEGDTELGADFGGTVIIYI